MKTLSCAVITALFTVAFATPLPNKRDGSPFDFLVIFGDSYSDDGFGYYYSSHGSTFPPPGTRADRFDTNASGGLIWGQYIEQQTGATVYDYAVGGATCSNSIVTRSVPAVLDQTVPFYQTDSKSDLYKDVTAENTVYAIWIGTNDLGEFFGNHQQPGKTPSDYVNCIWNSFDLIYASGGRRFILLNNIALDLAPVYQTPDEGGVVSTPYLPNKPEYNQDAIDQQMHDLVASVNQQMVDEAPNNIATRWPDAKFSILNVNQLSTDIYNNPQSYLEAPYSTGFYQDCPAEGCPADRRLDSYMWNDALHPSNKTGKSQP